MLQAGMHHLAVRFDFAQVKKDLAKKGTSFMKPFSYFSFLKQAFSVGQMWHVDRRRALALVRAGSIDAEEAKMFIKKGAVGSHLENIQRRQGFKGFNQEAVSVIIKATDPRKHKERGA